MAIARQIDFRSLESQTYAYIELLNREMIQSNTYISTEKVFNPQKNTYSMKIGIILVKMFDTLKNSSQIL